MKFFLRTCDRFSYILNLSVDQPLRAEDQSFLDKHSLECKRCQALLRTSMGLNMLRTCHAIEPESSDFAFEDRVIRRFKLERSRKSLIYWSPAVVGAAIAGIAILAALQMIAAPQQMPVFRGSGEAMKIEKPGPMIPEIELVNRASIPQ